MSVKLNSKESYKNLIFFEWESSRILCDWLLSTLNKIRILRKASEIWLCFRLKALTRNTLMSMVWYGVLLLAIVFIINIKISFRVYTFFLSYYMIHFFNNILQRQHILYMQMMVGAHTFCWWVKLYIFLSIRQIKLIVRSIFKQLVLASL